MQCYFLDFLKVKCTVDLIHIRNYPGVWRDAEQTLSLLDQIKQNAQQGHGVNKCYQTLSCISQVSTVTGVLVHMLFLL